MSGKDILIRLYKDGDERGIVRLFKEVFGREMGLDEWRWKYKESFPKKIYSVVAEAEEMGIVGHYGGLCLPFVFQGREIYGHAICDVMVHPRYRGIRIFRRLLGSFPVEPAKDGIRFGYGFPNSATLLKPALLSGFYEQVEDVIEATKNAAHCNDFDRYAFKLCPLDYSDPAIDRLWESAAHNLKLALVRNRRYLSWRYRDHPLFKYEFWGLKRRFGRELLGLAVLKKEEHRTLIMDFLFRDNLFSPLFLKLENHIFSAGARVVTLWIPPFMEKALSESGFSTAPAGVTIPRSTHKNWLTNDQIKGNFFYTMGDTDFM